MASSKPGLAYFENVWFRLKRELKNYVDKVNFKQYFEHAFRTMWSNIPVNTKSVFVD